MRSRCRDRFLRSSTDKQYGALALEPFLGGAEKIRAISPHVSLVDQPRQPARSRQHREQRHFRQRDVGRAIVGHHDVVRREREFVASAGTCSADSGHVKLAGITGGILYSVASLIGELAEVHLKWMARL